MFYLKGTLLLFMLFNSFHLVAQILKPEHNKHYDWGYVDAEGKWVIDAKYSYAYQFSGDGFDHRFTLVRTSRKNGELPVIIDKEGKAQLEGYDLNDVEAMDYRNGFRFISGRFIPKEKNETQYFIFDFKTGRYIVLAVDLYPYSALYHEDVQKEKYIITIDSKTSKKGMVLADSLTLVASPIYDEIKLYKGKNYILVSKDGKYGVLDSNCKKLIDFKYKSIAFQKDDKSAKVVLDKNELLVDLNDHVLKTTTY